jgi:hypothetical protein
MVNATDNQVDEVVKLYERKRQAEREAEQARERRQIQERKKALLEGRSTRACGPCRACIRQILAEVPLDQSLCERA